MKRTIEGMDFFSRFFHFKRIQSTNRMQKGNDMTTFLSVTQKFTCRLCSWYFSYTEKYVSVFGNKDKGCINRVYHPII